MGDLFLPGVWTALGRAEWELESATADLAEAQRRFGPPSDVRRATERVEAARAELERVEDLYV